MANESIPYLCGGTFLAQVLRARLPLTTAADIYKQQKRMPPGTGSVQEANFDISVERIFVPSRSVESHRSEY